MAVIVVAGGLGDFGLLIVNALLETRKHVVYIMTRKAAEYPTLESPQGGQRYNPIIQTDYSSEDALAAQLAERGVTLVICAFIMDNEKVCEAELRLIRAAEMTGTTTRFIPSEFNVEYDTPDSILPYPEKEYHMRARHELAMTTTLEYTYIYTGMFMDYFGMPKVPSTLRPLAFFIDPAHRKAVLPWGTLPKMSMTFSTDAARYIAYAIELKQWPRIMTTATGSINVRDILRQVEQNRDLPFQAVIVMDYRNPQVLGDETARDLPTNVQIARDYPERFPGGMQQVRELIANLELSVALGAYDFDHLDGHLDLAKLFKDIGPPAKRIEDVIKDAWGQGTAGLIRVRD